LLLSGAYKKFNLRSLKIISYGTEPMPESTLKRLNTVFPDANLMQTYGLIELGVMSSKSKNNNSLWVKIGGDGYHTRVVNGMLEIKSHCAMLGYLNAPSPFTDDGWFKTGDSVEIDGEYFKILGRKSEIINVGGLKVYPQEVENIILKMDNVAEVTVYGEKNAIIGAIVCARIKLNTNVDKKQFKINVTEFCREMLEDYKVPVKVAFIEEDLFGARYKKKRI